MKRTLSKEARHLAVGIVFAILGLLLGSLSGCDGGDGGSDGEVVEGDAGVGSGLKVWSDGTRYCDVPSPAGDEVNRSTGRTARQDVMRELEDKSFLAFVVVEEYPNPVMSVASTCAAQYGKCSDAAHDLASPSGQKHCLVLGCEDGTSTCAVRVVTGLDELDESAGKPRSTAACFADGRFAGWWCNNNS